MIHIKLLSFYVEEIIDYRVQVEVHTFFFICSSCFSGGLYDAHMGPTGDRGVLMCTTCYLTAESCPGHLGHMELPLPVCNPLFYSTILRMLKISCMHCHRFRVPEHIKKLYYVQQRLLDCGDIIAAQQGN